jgi:menaquinone-9 beta-reductase
MTTRSFDAVVVGGSLAGCATAILLGRAGLQVALVERHEAPLAFKHLCTHYIQASALESLQRIGLDQMIEHAGGIRNAAEIHTPFGWIGHHLGSRDGNEAIYGYNIRRSKLDPMLRKLASETPGVTLFAGLSANRLLEADGTICGVEATGKAGAVTLKARVVVGADGRNSTVATLAGVVPRSRDNVRGAIVASLFGVGLRRGKTSQMWLCLPNAAYLFPNDDGVSVLVWLGLRAQFEHVGGEALPLLKDRFAALPDAPDLQRTEPLGKPMVLKDYPNLWRPAVVRGMPLVGDAQLSIDPISGVGCGWAFEMASWLSDAIAGDLKAGRDLTPALQRYADRCNALAQHRRAIVDFSTRTELNRLERLMFSAATKDVGMARHLNMFFSRLIAPGEFVTLGSIARAAWVTSTRRSSPDGTLAAQVAVLPRELTPTE